MLGSIIAAKAISTIGSTREGAAVMPAVRAAIKNVAAWPATPSVEARTMPGHARRASSPSWMSLAAALRSRAHPDRVPAVR